jgi:hypothetical protein
MIIICLICWGGRYARSLILVSLVIVIYAVMQAITWHRVIKNNVIPVAP